MAQNISQTNYNAGPLTPEHRVHSGEIVWVYWVKAIGIFLVLWGHEILPHRIYSWIFSFHMPLFFFISGYLTKHKHTIAFGPYIKKYAYSLLVPYCCLGMIAYIIWCAKNLFHPGAELTGPEAISLWDPLWGMLYATGIPIERLIHSSALWFLPALFSIFILHWMVKKIIKSDLFYFVAAVVISCLGWLSFKYLDFRLPMGIENAMLGFLFFAMGNLAHKKHLVLSRRMGVLVAAICLVLQLLMLKWQNWPIPSFLSGQIDNPIVCYITAMFGVCFLIGVAMGLPRVAAAVRVSKNTITMFTLQNSVKLCVSAVFYLLHIQFDLYSSNLLFGIGSAIVTLFCLSIFAEFVRKCWPVLLGEKSR